MIETSSSRWQDDLVCPRCRTSLRHTPDGGLQCGNCALASVPFPVMGGKPVLVDFSNSILDRDAVLASAAASPIRRGGWRALLTRAVNGTNRIAPRIAQAMLARLAMPGTHRARVLVVGGGAIGAGAEALYAAADIDLIGFDIYASQTTDFVADAHAIPFADGSIDAVWIQAVLEHVADPGRVVAEIVRVLRPGGLVFADTPFLWPVHEQAYDFTRWSPSGHRWLFRDFAVIAAGTSSGPGTASLLALRYLAAALTRSNKLGQLLTLPLVWLRLLDRWCAPRRSLDAAAGLFFFGCKTDRPLDLKGLVRFYDEQLPLEAAARSGNIAQTKVEGTASTPPG